ncbi:MAG TPA: DUF4880 domain-containing protein [Methylibium sp.]|uniref:DUF4880 domain-containing protein n=1 Tax=Methylibium sp. TaxID=2067992 RepID=UPI002DBC2925|nr:DUF4880 domain-containing protein [Methylibium sp.]HEU4459582.1 DUF4880 domain-containing protein [Methylibium sp.]
MSGPASALDTAMRAAAMRQAVDWAVRLRGEDASAADRAAFEAWRAADARHEAAYQEVLRSLKPLATLRAGGCSPAMVQAVTRRARVSATRRGALALGIFGATAGLGGVLGWRRADDAGLFADARTGTGERRTLASATSPGSLLLDAHTALDPIGPRVARLFDGRLMVGIDRVEGLPWRLLTPVAEVVANGARASIELRGRVLRVAALEGAVALGRRDGPAAEVSAGRAVVLADGELQSMPVSVNDTLWTRGLVQLDNEPLARLVAALQPYRAGVLRADERAGALRLSGVFSLDDTEATLRAVARTLPVEVTRRTDYWVTISAA